MLAAIKISIINLRQHTDFARALMVRLENTAELASLRTRRSRACFGNGSEVQVMALRAIVSTICFPLHSETLF